MIEKFKTILESMDAKGNTSVALLALLKMDDLTDRWTVIYADESSSLTEEKRKEIFDNLLSEIKATLTSEELSLIARLGVFTTTDHLVQALLRYQSGVKIQNEKVNGNFVHEGYIIKAATKISQDEKATSPSTANTTDKAESLKDNET